MSSTNEWRTLPPKSCPYCGANPVRLPSHLPCEAVPSTEEVVGR